MRIRLWRLGVERRRRSVVTWLRSPLMNLNLIGNEALGAAEGGLRRGLRSPGEGRRAAVGRRKRAGRVGTTPSARLMFIYFVGKLQHDLPSKRILWTWNPVASI
jgi:hypothetical protein